jgi:hypothetical protein
MSGGAKGSKSGSITLEKFGVAAKEKRNATTRKTILQNTTNHQP